MIASEGSRDLFIDGTCRFVPLGFYQFLVLMIYISSMYLAIPIFSVFLPNAQLNTYHFTLRLCDASATLYGGVLTLDSHFMRRRRAGTLHSHFLMQRRAVTLHSHFLRQRQAVTLHSHFYICVYFVVYMMVLWLFTCTKVLTTPTTFVLL